MPEFIVDGKPVFISSHAIKQARQRSIAFPDQIYDAIRSGKIHRFAKNHLKFVKRSKQGSIICVAVDLGQAIIIKTVERGN